MAAPPLVTATATAPVAAAPQATLSEAPAWSSDDVQRVGGIALGDANRDGVLDVAIGTYAGGSTPAPVTTLVFLGDGNAVETSPSWESEEGTHTTSLGWGVFAGSEPSLLIVNGGVLEQPPAMYGGDGMLGSTVSWVGVSGREGSGLDYAIGDVNGDGVNDLFISNQCFTPCTEAPNVGYVSTGGAIPEQANWLSSNLGQFGGIALVDMDGSHLASQVHTASGDGTRQVFWVPRLPVHSIQRVLVDGNDAGPLSYDLRSGYVQLATAPADGAEVEIIYETSTAPDLLISARPGGILVYANDGDGIATAPTALLGSEAAGYKVLLPIDVDQDGVLDIVAAGNTGAAIDVFRSEHGTLTSSPSWSSANDDFGANDMAVGDFNGDGFTDVVAARFTDAVMLELFINHEGELETEASFTMPYAGASMGAIGAGDMTGDAMPELIIGYSGAPMAAYENASTPVAPPVLASYEADDATLTIQGSDFRAPVRVFAGEHLLPGVQLSGDTITADVSGLPEGRYQIVVVNPGLRASASPDKLVVGNPPEDPDDPDGPGGPGGDSAADGAGCGCRTGTSNGSSGAVLLLLGVAATLRRRRMVR